MPQSPKTCGYKTPTIKAELDGKCLSANSTNNNNTIFNFPSVQLTTTTADEGAIRKSSSDQFSTSSTMANGSSIHTTSAIRHHEGKNMDVCDINVNVNVVTSCASSIHPKISTSCCPSLLSSSDPSTNTLATNIITNNNVQSSSNNNNNNINVISVCDNSDSTNGNGIIIAEAHDGASYYDAIKLEDNNGTTAIIYETIVIENPSTHTQNHELVGLMSTMSNNNYNNNNNINNNNKYITNKNHITLEAAANVAGHTTASNGGGGGIIVLTGSLNELLLSQNGHVVTNSQLCQPHSSGNGHNIKCLNDVKNQIQSIVLNLNSQSSASTTTSSITTGQGQMAMGNQQSIMLAINSNQQVNENITKKISSIPFINKFFSLFRMIILYIQKYIRRQQIQIHIMLQHRQEI